MVASTNVLKVFFFRLTPKAKGLSKGKGKHNSLLITVYHESAGQQKSGENYCRV